MKKSYKEILEILKEKIERVDDFAYGYFDQKELGLGKIEEVDSYGGEGQGEKWYSVKYFVDHDVYIRVDGFYSSYNGTDFEGWGECKEVRPQTKQITVYEK